MRAVIDKIVTVVELDNGVVFERFVSWDGRRTGFEDVKKYIHDSKGRGVVRRQQYLVLDNGVEVDVSIHEALHILPDRTGVLGG
ncbi:hypothetical protein ACIOWE_04955 [Pseudomonas sp. NPDC087598]|uniref:hypothetical protein n=1 Tax=Pseudomonas sp. NPDC087598 TaxID=3364440 RepID=UPI003810D37E